MCDVPGFIIYVLLVLSLLFAITTRKDGYLLTGMMLIATLVAAFRGTAGPDTILYMKRFENIASLQDIPLIEPAIPLLMWTVKSSGGTFVAFSIVYGIILTILYSQLFKRIPNAICFGLILFPVLFIDSLYNGLRVGLAYPLVIFAIVYASKPTLLLASTGHISAFMASPFKVFPKTLIAGLLVLFVGFLLYFNLNPFDLLSDRYASKFAQYSESSTKWAFSGIADVLTLFAVFCIYVHLLGYRKYRYLIIVSVAFAALAIIQLFILPDYSFILRVNRMMVFILFGLIANQDKELGKEILYISFLIGIVYCLNFFRQIDGTCSYPVSGFLPMSPFLPKLF